MDLCLRDIKDKFATTNSNFEKNRLFRHASSYTVHVAFINLQQTLVSRSIQTVHTKFANNRKLHKFATINSNFGTKMIISDINHRITYM